MKFIVLAIAIGTALGAVATGILILLDAVDREGEWYFENVSRPSR